MRGGKTFSETFWEWVHLCLGDGGPRAAAGKIGACCSVWMLEGDRAFLLKMVLRDLLHCVALLIRTDNLYSDDSHPAWNLRNP